MWQKANFWKVDIKKPGWWFRAFQTVKELATRLPCRMYLATGTSLTKWTTFFKLLRHYGTKWNSSELILKWIFIRALGDAWVSPQPIRAECIWLQQIQQLQRQAQGCLQPAARKLREAHYGWLTIKNRTSDYRDCYCDHWVRKPASISLVLPKGPEMGLFFTQQFLSGYTTPASSPS